mmetsp:Transcript_19215/g.38403  ORF Transcript_19215/g.38403 Transcript_19215/m.38403 type:complete len:191 (+) Transcript_19215:231-803(+)
MLTLCEGARLRGEREAGTHFMGSISITLFSPHDLIPLLLMPCLSCSSGVGLFDQLQKNKDAKEEEWEAKRNGLMGVRPLDEEDVDHLNAYQESRDKKRRKREEEDDAEVEIFKRTREMKRQGEVVLEKKDDDADGKARGKEDESSAPEEKASVVIVKKKKKKRQVDKKVEKVEEENKLTSLLGDYGSDSE